MMAHRVTLSLVTVLPMILVAACGGSGGGGSPAPAPPAPVTYTVGGAVTGLSGTLVLRNNGANNLTITANGAFTFSAPISSGSSYAVTVATQPAGQSCTVANGSATIAGNVTSVAVSCSTVAVTYAIGGTLTGLTGNVVVNNGSDGLSLTADGHFTFPSQLPNGTAYNVTLSVQPSGQTCAVTSGTGTVNGADVTSVVVTCVAGGWSGPVRIDTRAAGGSSVLPQVALDGSSNALVIWYQGNGSVWAARYAAASASWVASVNVEPVNSVLAALPLATANPPRIGAAANGDAIAVYRRANTMTGRISIVAAHFTAGAWTPGLPIEDDETGDAAWPRIAVEPNGNAIAVWNQRDAAQINNIVANRYTPPSWGADVLVENQAGFVGVADQFPSVAFNAALNGLVVFDHRRPVSTIRDTFTNAYGGAAWTGAQLRSDGLTTVSQPEVAMNAAGDVFIVWAQSNGMANDVIAKRFTVATGWEANQVIEASAASASEPQIAVASGGSAIAIWTQGGDIVANRYTPGGGWSTAAPIESGNEPAHQPRIAMHSDGDAIAVWAQRDVIGADAVAAKYFTAASGTWGEHRWIGTNGPLGTYDPAIAMDTAGNAIVVWRQEVLFGPGAGPGVHYVHANRYQR